jgi:hypothetical protein
MLWHEPQHRARARSFVGRNTQTPCAVAILEELERDNHPHMAVQAREVLAILQRSLELACDHLRMEREARGLGAWAASARLACRPERLSEWAIGIKRLRSCRRWPPGVWSAAPPKGSDHQNF